MLSLVATGFLLVATPLTVAMPFAYQQVERLVQRSDDTLDLAVRLTEQVEYFANTLRGAERVSRQYLILETPELLDTARARVQRLQTILERIQQPDDARLDTDFAALIDQTRQLANTLQAVAPQRDDVLPAFAAVDMAHAQTYAGVQIYIAKQRRVLQETADRTQRVLTLPFLALIPITVLLALIFTWLVIRPFRGLSQAIGQLSAQDFDTPVAVSGPLEIRRLGEQLDRTREQLGAAADSKDSFLRHMSHELKTPLASIVEGLSLLRDGTAGPVNDAQGEIHQIMTVSADQLHRRIDNLLKYSEWVDDLRAPSFETVHLPTLFERICTGLSLVAGARQVRIVHDAGNLQIVAHTESLRVAVDNLVSNAVRHSPEYGTVDLRAFTQDGHWVIEVSDQGPGVDAADAERIFEPFTQGQAPQFGAIRGSGVGLSLVRAAMRMHGGTVAVESSASGGARFILTIPTRTTP